MNTHKQVGVEDGLRESTLVPWKQEFSRRSDFVATIVSILVQGDCTPEYMEGVRHGASRGWSRRYVEERSRETASLPSIIPVFDTVDDIPLSASGEVRTRNPPRLWLKSRHGLKQVR